LTSGLEEGTAVGELPWEREREIDKERWRESLESREKLRVEREKIRAEQSVKQ